MALRIVLNRSAVKQILRSGEVKAELARRANAIAAHAGDGFEAESETGPNRARAVVFTATFEAAREEALHRALTRAFGAGR